MESQQQWAKTLFLATLAVAAMVKTNNLVTITNRIEERNSWTKTNLLTVPPQKGTQMKNQLNKETVDKMMVKLLSGLTMEQQTECQWLEVQDLEKVCEMI